MDLQRNVNFEINTYDAFAEMFSVNVKELILSTIERGQFNTKYYMDETFEDTAENIYTKMMSFGPTYTNGGGSVVVITEEFILKTEIVRDEGNIRFKLWILSIQERIPDIVRLIRAKFQDCLYDKMALDISWGIMSRGNVEFISMQAELDEVVIPEAYPFIEDFDSYVDAYLESKSPVLLLIGVPGTGKTRFIKHIIKTIGLKRRSQVITEDIDGIDERSRGTNRNSRNPSILYSMEDKIFKDDQFFVRFLSDAFDAMVLEDIDFNLGSRKDGNTFMYKILGGSDGLTSGVKRKIILSTNLRGISNIDDALLRPGRCFDTLSTRPLTAEEAQVLAGKINKDLSKIKKKSNKDTYTLAEIYNLG